MYHWIGGRLVELRMDPDGTIHADTLRLVAAGREDRPPLFRRPGGTLVMLVNIAGGVPVRTRHSPEATEAPLPPDSRFPSDLEMSPPEPILEDFELEARRMAAPECFRE